MCQSCLHCTAAPAIRVGDHHDEGVLFRRATRRPILWRRHRRSVSLCRSCRCRPAAPATSCAAPSAAALRRRPRLRACCAQRARSGRGSWCALEHPLPHMDLCGRDSRAGHIRSAPCPACVHLTIVCKEALMVFEWSSQCKFLCSLARRVGCAETMPPRGSKHSTLSATGPRSLIECSK